MDNLIHAPFADRWGDLNAVALIRLSSEGGAGRVNLYRHLQIDNRVVPGKSANLEAENPQRSMLFLAWRIIIS